MRRRVIYAGMVAVVGAAVVVGGVLGLESDAIEAYNRDNLIRIHVIPHSDSEADQALKLRVRDAITDEMRLRLDGLTDVNEARSVVIDNLDLVQRTAEREVRAAGRDYPVRVAFGTFDFPTREYGDLVVPEGKYQAVRVVLGNGDGANWWCVLFPPLCFVHNDAGTQEEVLTAWRDNAPTQVKMKLRTVELWEKSTDLVRQVAQRFEW